ncbi:MAG: penicillin-binding protein 2, partial [Actinobacteria bacterium]
PGSVNKVVTAAAALEGHIADPAEILTIPNSYRIADKTFHDLESHPTWKITYGEALARSSNIGTIEVAQRVGKPRLYGMLRRFGLGQKTDVGYPGESSGVLLDAKHWYATSMGTIPIGQGIAVTPLQIARVYATIANDGVSVRPRIVEAAGRSGPMNDGPALDPHRVVSSATAAQLRAMLVGVVEDGTGRNARMPGYLIGGKTGTARKPKVGARGYTHDVVTTFVGMVPAESPRFVAAVVLDAPDTHMSAVTAAPAFKEIVQFVVGRLDVPPSLAMPEAAPARRAAATSKRP